MEIVLFIYQGLAENNLSDDDIQDYINYIAERDPHKEAQVRAFIKACKIYKTKMMLLKEDLPKPHEIEIYEEHRQIDNSWHIMIKKADPKPED